MNKIIIPVLASVLILGFLGTAEDAFAPKKLFVGGLSWDSESQAFVVEYSVNHGIANAGQKAGFVLDTTLKISDATGQIKFLSSIDLMADFEYSKGPVRTTFSNNISCDPFCTDIQGLVVDVEVNAQILNPAGKPVGETEKDFEDVFIELPSEICDDGIDNDGDGRIDCEDENSCAEFPACVEPPTGEVCDNGIDDNGDGLVDCFDADCATDPVCGPSDNP